MKEYLLKNVLDKEFQRMLYPLNLLQSIVLQPKYRILDGFVTPNGISALLKCVLGVILVIITNILKFWAFQVDVLADKTDEMFALCVFDALYYSVSSFITFVVNFVQSQNNVKLILKMQQVYRVFDSKLALRRFRNQNWIVITLAALTHLMFLCFNYARDYLDLAQMLLILSLFYFDGNIVFATQTMFFLEHEVKQWIVELDRFRSVCSEPNHNKLTKYFSEIDQQEKKLFNAYLDILKASKKYKSVFQYSILLLTIELFVHPLLYIKIFLSVTSIVGPYDRTAANIFYALVPSLWVVKNFMLLVRVCVACQRFELALREADKMSAIICSYHESLYTLNIQKLCKNVCRLNANSRADGGLRAGGVVAVNAALPLRLLALLATYTVVLLQFALL